MKCPTCGGTIKKGKGADPDEAWRARLVLAFPGVDIDAEIEKARRWIILHPGRQLTRLFVQRWLSKADQVVRGASDVWQGIQVGSQEQDRADLEALRSKRKA